MVTVELVQCTCGVNSGAFWRRKWLGSFNFLKSITKSDGDMAITLFRLLVQKSEVVVPAIPPPLLFSPLGIHFNIFCLFTAASDVAQPLMLLEIPV
jgi:hypothetical protein